MAKRKTVTPNSVRQGQTIHLCSHHSRKCYVGSHQVRRGPRRGYLGIYNIIINWKTIHGNTSSDTCYLDDETIFYHSKSNALKYAKHLLKTGVVDSIIVHEDSIYHRIKDFHSKNSDVENIEIPDDIKERLSNGEIIPIKEMGFKFQDAIAKGFADGTLVAS